MGSPRLAGLPDTAGLSCVTVDEVLAPGARALTVEVRPAARTARQVTLELPSAPQCVRLLRDPFVAATAAPRLEAVAARGLRFSADGLRLMMAYENGDVAAQVVPNSPRDTVPRFKRFIPPQGEHVVGMGWRRPAGLLVVTRREDTLLVHGALRGRRSGTLHLPLDSCGLRLPLPGSPPLLVLSQVRGGVETPLLLDAGGTLRLLHWDARSEASFLPLAEHVAALAEFQGRLFFVGRVFQDNPPVSARAGWLEGIRWPLMPLRGTEQDALEAFIGQGGDLRSAQARPRLALRSHDTWSLWRGERGGRAPAGAAGRGLHRRGRVFVERSRADRAGGARAGSPGFLRGDARRPVRAPGDDARLRRVVRG